MTITGASDGAIVNRENLTIANSAISANSRRGIENEGQLTIIDSTISGNARGGIYNSGGQLTVIGSTISGNTVYGFGGGIYNSDGVMVIQYTTITENEAPTGRSGGVANAGSAVTEVRSTIIAGNLNNDVQGDNNSFVTFGYNLIGSGNAVGNFNAPGDQTGITDPLLGPLADNGGPTQTHAILPGSPALDAGDPNAVAGVGTVPLYDQRGDPHTRVANGRIDIGAFELRTSTLPDGDFNDGDLNDDGIYDGLDIDALVAEIAAATNGLAFDVTGDELVDLGDRDAWLAEAGSINLGAASSVTPRVATLVAIRVDSVFAMSRRGEDQNDERLNADSFKNLGDDLPTPRPLIVSPSRRSGHSF